MPQYVHTNVSLVKHALTHTTHTASESFACILFPECLRGCIDTLFLMVFNTTLNMDSEITFDHAYFSISSDCFRFKCRLNE